jgi:phage terminase large subunit
MNILWSELKKNHEKCVLKDLIEWKKTQLCYKGFEDTWFAVAKTSNKPEALQGVHAEHVLIVVDEASGIDAEIFEVLEGALTQDNSIMMMFGNPTRTSGGFFDAFNSKRKFFYTFKLSCLDSPRVKKSYAEKIAAKYGIDSDVYRVRVLGEFPIKAQDSIIPIHLVEECFKNEPDTEVNTIEIGCDVARFGSDETTIYYRTGNVIKELEVYQGQDTMKTAGKISNFVNGVIEDYEDVIINIDDTGVGGGVTDRLREVYSDNLKVTINGINNGSRAVEHKQYFNRVSEMWFYFKEWLKTGIIPDDEDLKAQLSIRKYDIQSNGKLRIEGKDAMKKRSITSPDRADGVILTTNSLTKFNVMTNTTEIEDIGDDARVKNVEEFRTKSFKDRMKFYKKRT